MPERTPEDRLREEYFDLLPEIRSVTENLEAEVRYHVLPILRDLRRSEQIVVKSRIKECDRAVDALRRRQKNSRIFDPERAEAYSLLELKDLAGVRVLAFPRSRRIELDEALRKEFPVWDRDPFWGDPQEILGFKYSGFHSVSERVRGEYQIVSMLVGLFWEVEHSAIYKPIPEFRSAAHVDSMQERTQEVLRSLTAFEEEFERIRNESDVVKNQGKL
jgi:ppGpp synthetase/RelA/SpoT-type nucleotidyltranferase